MCVYDHLIPSSLCFADVVVLLNFCWSVFNTVRISGLRPFSAVVLQSSFFAVIQGSHASLKVLEFFSSKFKALKVLENRAGAWKSLNFIPQVLESTWIHQVKLHYIKNFVKQHLYRTRMRMLYLLRNLPGILRNTRFVNNCYVMLYYWVVLSGIKHLVM